MQQFGLYNKRSDFKAFRFPSAADRLLLWAPDAVADRLSFELPRGGYQVNLGQLGSDHRPVALEVVMRVAHADQPLRMSRSLATTDIESIHSLLEQSEDDEEFAEQDFSTTASMVPEQSFVDDED